MCLRASLTLISYRSIGRTTSPATVLNNCIYGSETCNSLISLNGIHINKQCPKELAFALVCTSACVFHVLKCTEILINCVILENIGKVCTGVVVNNPIVAVAASLVVSCVILWRIVHIYHMRKTLCLVWLYCSVERYRFLLYVVLCQYKEFCDNESYWVLDLEIVEDEGKGYSGENVCERNRSLYDENVSY